MEETLTTYFKAASYLPQIDGTDYDITDADAAWTRLVQPSPLFLILCRGALVAMSLDAGNFTMSMSGKKTSLKRFMLLSVVVCDHTELHMQGQPCTTELVTQHHCKRHRDEPMSILRKRVIVVKTRIAAVVAETFLQVRLASSRGEGLSQQIRLRWPQNDALVM